MPRTGREFFYLENHRIEDAKLHDAIIADGDDKTARKISKDVAKRLGLTEAEIAALYKPAKKGK